MKMTRHAEDCRPYQPTHRFSIGDLVEVSDRSFYAWHQSRVTDVFFPPGSLKESYACSSGDSSYIYDFDHVRAIVPLPRKIGDEVQFLEDATSVDDVWGPPRYKGGTWVDGTISNVDPVYRQYEVTTTTQRDKYRIPADYSQKLRDPQPLSIPSVPNTFQATFDGTITLKETDD